MQSFDCKNLSVTVDYFKGQISSLKVKGKERIFTPSPLFKIGLLSSKGEKATIDATCFQKVEQTSDGAIYSGFSGFLDGFDLADFAVRCVIKKANGEIKWKIALLGLKDNYLAEWVQYPFVILPPLVDNNDLGTGGEILLPYNEGALIRDVEKREMTWFRYTQPAYPSQGCFTVFPNMICSQFISYLWSDCSIYLGAHDRARTIKHIDYAKDNGGIALIMRTYCGKNFGENYEMPFFIVMRATGGHWTSPCDRYRRWFKTALPRGVKKITENESLPSWYRENPLIVSYPVRGIHDMDEMKPNALYPYTNALPIIDEIQNATNSKIMALLMHWEGTAPWAPPYVWPPYGGGQNFKQFHDELKRKGNLLGVYCSGFGYTMQSNLIAKYNKQAEYDKKGLDKAMCKSEKGEIKSEICTAQRQGYDVCPVSKVGKRLLEKAYLPLFKSGIDYAQILDQNHGGGQYFCYATDHGHPPAPGEWMTKNMQKMLTRWNTLAPNMLFGCESSASEPFIGNLAFSDNRYELNYMLGQPVPVFAYLYHEYLRNFMGNQVCCALDPKEDTLCYRLAYSFSAGDAMTIVLSPNGNLLPHWGYRENAFPDKEKALLIIKNLTALYNEQGKTFLDCGKMIKPVDVKCESVTFKNEYVNETTLPKVLTSAWENESGKQVQYLINPFDYEVTCRFKNKKITLAPLNGVCLPLN